MRPAALLPPLSFALAFALALSGCIGPLDKATDTNAPHPVQGGSMDGTETATTDSGLCKTGLDLSPDKEFCATRTVTVRGAISGIPALDIDVSTFNGRVGLAAGSEGAWGFVAKLEGRGQSQSEADANLKAIELTWSHEQPGGHVVNVVAKSQGNSDKKSAAIDVTMPPALVWRVVASSTNGAVEAKDIKTDGLSLHSTNGAVSAVADVTQVDLASTNGAISGTLTPTGSGRIAIASTNGAIHLKLPESSGLGYDLEARTTNGDVKIGLKDGTVGACPEGSQYYTPPCNHRTFQTKGFDARAIRQTVVLGTTNGGIEVQSA